MRRHLLPSYEPRFPAPQRAVLTLLRAALVVAVDALRDEHPLLDSDDLREHHAPDVVRTAALIVACAHELCRLCDRYDDAVDAVLAHDDQVPF